MSCGYEYKTPLLVNAGSERDVETRFLLECLHGLSGNGAMSVLDVGFAGSGYIEDIQAIREIEYTGMDSSAKRISGKSLHRTNEGMAAWRKTMEKTKFVTADILNEGHVGRYDVVMSISMIEHLVPLGYGIQQKFSPDLDMKAIERMKEMSLEWMLLTFPCGVEKKYCDKDNAALVKHGFSVCRHGLIIYDEARYKRVVGDWIPEREMFCVSEDGVMKNVPKERAFKYEHKDSFVKAVCGVLMRRP